MAARKRNVQVDVGTMQPDELNELKKTVGEFIRRLQNIDNEIELLKESRKDLLSEFKTKLDTKTLKAAMQVVKIESTVSFKETYDLFLDVLKDDVTNGHVVEEEDVTEEV